MRPHLLNPLFAALTSLTGVGPKVDKLYRRLLGREEAPRVLDLLFHLPTGTIDRRARPKLRDVVPDTVVTVAVTVDRHRPAPPHRSRAPYQIYASDETGDIVLTFFNARRDYLEKLLPVGERRYVSGHGRALRRHAPDGASRPRDRRGRSRQSAADRAGLSAHRRALAQPGAQGGRRRARPRARPAGMAGRELGRARALSALRRRAAPRASPGRARGCLAGRRGMDAARLRRTAGGPARARAGARASAPPGRPGDGGRRAPAQEADRGAALFAHAFADARASPTSSPIWPSPSACCGCCRATSDRARPWSR